MLDISAVKKIQDDLEVMLKPHGFEVHPFLVGWYNNQVSPKFIIDSSPSTLAFIVVSQPKMFENAFLPFLRTHARTGLHDPIDECMLHYFSKVQEKFPSVTTLHDFQLTQTRRPKILVQTAGHVSGAVRFYRPQEYPDLVHKTYYPVCHHPVWGGWFALRGVIIFNDVAAQLEYVEPESFLSEEQAVEMIKLYNECWQDWRWRDVGRRDNFSEKYSDLQIKYFETKPAERNKIIENLLD